MISCGGDPLGPGLFGYLPTDELWWRNANPPDLAANLRGTALYLSAGNGLPCDPTDVAGLTEPQEGASTQPFQLTEPIVAQGTRGLAAALDRAGIPYTADLDRCGLHTWRYWQRDLHAYWPLMAAAFHTPPPSTWDHQRADPVFSVWGWTFTADPRRAPEFLRIRAASATGLTLTGSGTQTVTTAAYFPPGQAVPVNDGTSVRLIAADGSGRLTLTIDLGPPHAVRQFRPENALAGAAPGYFTTRTIRLG